jgi:hypothetical protein
MTDRLKPGTRTWDRRQECWKHNSFLGHARMMQMNCQAILNSKTATEEAKAIAVRIENDAEMLETALKIRKVGI